MRDDENKGVSFSFVETMPLTPLVPFGAPVLVWMGAGSLVTVGSCVGATAPLAASVAVSSTTVSLVAVGTLARGAVVPLLRLGAGMDSSMEATCEVGFLSD